MSLLAHLAPSRRPKIGTVPQYSVLGQQAKAPAIAGLMKAALENPRLLSLAAGFTDPATLPVREVCAALDQLADRDGDPEFLQYGIVQGRPELRRQLAARLERMEPAIAAPDLSDRLFITNGSQQALYLALQVLCDPGDIVLVDRPSYFAFLDLITGVGAQARSLPFDDQGRLGEDVLRAFLSGLVQSGEVARVKAVYLVSYFSNPSGRCLEEADKAMLGRVLREFNLVVPVMEDAAYRELYYETQPTVRSVLSLPEWQDFPRLYLATLTKLFATGIKVGYGYCTDATWQQRMLAVKGGHDFGTANFNQALLEQVIRTGALDRHLKRLRPAYHAKMHCLHETLRGEKLPQFGWSWEQPAGGLYLWLRGPAGLDTSLDEPFYRACLAADVLYVPGSFCFGDHAPANFIRLSFGVLAQPQLIEAGRRFSRAAALFRA